MALTKRQFQVLQFLDSFAENNGYCPSFEEIAKSLRLSSLATVHKHIHNLEQKGYISCGYNQSRSIEILNRKPLQGIKSKTSAISKTSEFEIPLLGRIAAGRPLEAVTNRESLSFGDFVGSKDVYVLRVKGDSMIEDHICDGDYVVVENVSNAESGDTVVALIEQNEATLKKYFREKNGYVRLQPSNSSLEPILVKEQDLNIQGRVIGVLRKY